jgi:hypothetical protein
MKIRVICENCEREFLLRQLVEGPDITGRCPKCGEPLAPGYLEVLPELIRKVEASGSEFAAALKHLSGEWTRFRIRSDSVWGPLKDVLTRPKKPPSVASRAA